MTENINQILAKNSVSCSRGAPMGARNFHNSQTPLNLQRVRMVDGDYSPDGTYWGSSRGSAIYCAFNGRDCPEFAPAHGSRIFVRAVNRADAMRKIAEQFEVTFKRGAV